MPVVGTSYGVSTCDALRTDESLVNGCDVSAILCEEVVGVVGSCSVALIAMDGMPNLAIFSLYLSASILTSVFS